jgi:hypothetical protein
MIFPLAMIFVRPRGLAERQNEQRNQCGQAEKLATPYNRVLRTIALIRHPLLLASYG